MNTNRELPCPLCDAGDETVLWRSRQARVLRVDDAAYAGFCRVAWNTHVAEMTDLAPAEQRYLMEIVFGVEAALRRVLAPTKVNLASLGNQVPHLHWHVIGRFDWDSHFPAPVWAAAQRAAPPERIEALRFGLAEVDAAIAARLPLLLAPRV